MKAFPILFFLFALSFISCDKDSGPSKTELLTDHCWKLAASSISPALNGVTDIYATMKPCEKDNVVCFSTGGTLTSDEGPLKCSVTDPQVIQGTWKLENDDKNFNITLSNGTKINADLLELTSTMLKLSFKVDVPGTTYTNTLTYLPI